MHIRSRIACRIRAVVVMTVFTALLPAIQALPQADRSAVDGVVRDPTGAVVPGCIVTLTRAGTGGKTTTLTN